MKQRRGLYAWGGPGTIDLIRTKYHSPHVDEASFLTLYDKDILSNIQECFGITDLWMTYSWGFSNKREKKHRAFAEEKLPNTNSLNITTHLYVQGPNLVEADFPRFTGWCRDPYGRTIPYSKGRLFTCPNNPDARAILAERTRAAAQVARAQGVFIDNIIFGLPPVSLYENAIPFYGCACSFCKEKFQKIYGYPLHFGSLKNKQMLLDYAEFRVNTTTEYVAELAQIVRKEGKIFGVNLYDPLLHEPEWSYGYSLEKILPHLDYLLIENHALHKNIGGLEYLRPLRNLTKKPIFVVSYKNGIGFDKPFSQTEYEFLTQENEKIGTFPCYKGTEFVQKKEWSALQFPLPNQLDTIALQPKTQAIKEVKSLNRLRKLFLSALSFWLVPTLHLYFSSALFGGIAHKLGISQRALTQPRRYKLP